MEADHNGRNEVRAWQHRTICTCGLKVAGCRRVKRCPSCGRRPSY